MDHEKIAELLDIIHSGDRNRMNAFYSSNPDCLTKPLCPQGRCAIHIAAREGHVDLVRYMIVRNPGLLEQTDYKQQTPLLHAVYKGRTAVVTYLLSKGGNYLARTIDSDHQGHQMTVIDWALKFNYQNCLNALYQTQLKEIKKNLSAQTENAVSKYCHLMHEAITSQNADALRYLLQEKGDFIRVLKKKFILDFLGRAQFVLPSDSLLIFLAPEMLALFQFSPQLLLEKAVQNRWNNLVTALVLDERVIGHQENKERFIELALKSTDHHIQNILIVILFQRFLQNQREQGEQLQSDWKPEDLFNSYLHTGKQVIELAAMDSRLIPYLLKTPYVENLLKNDETISKEASSLFAYYPANRKRRLSLFAEIKPSSLSIYSRKQIRGKGKYGIVSELSNDDGDSVAVKEFFSGTRQDVDDETIFNQLARPNQTSLAFFSEEFNVRGSINFEKRMVMPNIRGQVLYKALASINNTHDLAVLILKAAQKILYIHSIGIIHGDIKEDNFIIHKDEQGIRVDIVDFGLSYYRDEKWARHFITANHSGVAPETVGFHAFVKPHPRIDIYSFADMLRYLIPDSPAGTVFFDEFPLIKDFCESGIQRDPLKRPQSLKAFCEDLSRALEEVQPVLVGSSASI